MKIQLGNGLLRNEKTCEITRRQYNLNSGRQIRRALPRLRLQIPNFGL